MASNRLNRDIEEAVGILRRGGIIVYPTETVYGIGCDPMNYNACMRILDITKRDTSKAMLLLAYSAEQVTEMAGPLNEQALLLAEKFWPGPLTIIIKPSKNIPGYLLGKTEGAAFRVTSHPLSSAITKEFGMPIISTSANFSGGEPVENYQEALTIFGNKVDIVLNSDFKMKGKPSTIVDTTSGSIELIREGALSFKEIMESVAKL
jgi:L-threonylcarbamoyladenylate synthase